MGGGVLGSSLLEFADGGLDLVFGDGDLGMADVEKWDIPPELARKMHGLARELRQRATSAAALLWQAIRNRKLDGRKFRRQVPIGVFVVDFYCASERLVIEVDGPIHASQREADQLRQELIEALGMRFLRLENEEVEGDILSALARIRGMFRE